MLRRFLIVFFLIATLVTLDVSTEDNLLYNLPSYQDVLDGIEAKATQEQIIEFVKSKEDPVYFAKNYVKIVTLDHGLQPFNMYPFQEIDLFINGLNLFIDNNPKIKKNILKLKE